MLFVLILASILNCLEVIKELLSHCRCTKKIKNTRLFGPSQEFVGIDVRNEENILKETKKALFEALDAPNIISDLRMGIRIFGFYSLWIPL